MRNRPFHFASVLPALLMAALPSLAQAQGAARSMDIDPSVRSSGMGGASSAVFWDEVTNHWANPALLGYQRGLSYEWANTRLVPGLAADVHLSSNVIKLGGGGLGVALSGKPFGLGGIHLGYGETEGTDQNGNPTGAFDSFEQVDSWSFGISAARAAEAVAGMSGRDPKEWSRYGDVSFGMTGKHWEIDLGPSFGNAETDAHDLGYLARFSPTEFLPGFRDVVGLDVSYGWSDLSYDGKPVTFAGSSPADVSEHERRGYAGRIRFDWPHLARDMNPSWFWEGLRPLISFGLADDHSTISASSSRYVTDANGWELTIANVFSLRSGHYEDLSGGIDGSTSGWGVGIPFGSFGGARYDFATFPQAKDTNLSDLERHAASAWIDVMKIWRTSR